jgi:hypothetical protein
MSASEMDRIKSKLFALNMRLAEVNSEVAAVQARVFLLEKALEDARLAQLMGEECGIVAEISPELEHHRGTLEERQRLLKRIQHSQWETRVRYMIARRLQIQALEETQRKATGEEEESA